MRDPIALRIRYGNPQENSVEYRKPFQDRLVALGTPAFARRYNKLPTVSEPVRINAYRTPTRCFSTVASIISASVEMIMH